MENKANSSRNSRDLVTYFILAYAISWAIAIPLELAKHGVIQAIFPGWFHYLVAYGPILSALMVTWATRGQEGLREIWGRMTKWRVGAIWWLAAFSPVVIGLVSALVMNILTANKISLFDFGVVHFLPPLGMGALPLWILTFGFGEETGWRGYALPRLQKSHSALYATTILTFFWALWHLPQFFYLFDPSIAIGWVIGLYAGAIVFTWLINNTEGSILLAAVVSTVVMVWAVLVVMIYKPKTLSSNGRVFVQVKV
jgi:CAAX protease family protein